MPGRLTLGLWNSYDPRRFVEAHRRALVRAAPLALAFDANLVTFGFPYDDLAAGGGRVAERRGAAARAEPRRGETEAVVDLASPLGIAQHIAASTSIGEEGRFLVELAEKGRFAVYPLPKGGLPPQLGRVVLTTSKVDPAKATTAGAIATALGAGESILLLFGLGPHGVGKDARALSRADFDVTGRGASLETCTAFGACVAAIAFAPRRSERAE